MACDTTTTYIRKQRWAQWDFHDGHWFCHNCYAHYVRPPYPRNLERYRLWERKKRQYLREQLVNIIGGPKCIKCGITDTRVLQIDHINGRGTEIRTKEGHTHTLYWKLLKKDPEVLKNELQILCANCNWIKRFENNEIGRVYY